MLVSSPLSHNHVVGFFKNNSFGGTRASNIWRPRHFLFCRCLYCFDHGLCQLSDDSSFFTPSNPWIYLAGIGSAVSITHIIGEASAKDLSALSPSQTFHLDPWWSQGWHDALVLACCALSFLRRKEKRTSTSATENDDFVWVYLWVTEESMLRSVTMIPTDLLVPN